VKVPYYLVGNRESQQSAIRLKELGPRMRLEVSMVAGFSGVLEAELLAVLFCSFSKSRRKFVRVEFCSTNTVRGLELENDARIPH